MKKMNVFGAVLCSAALAAGMAMPAFAEGVSNPGSFTQSGAGKSATTVVDVEYSETVISATIPLKAVIAVETSTTETGITMSGQSTQTASTVKNITAPSPTDYILTNTGSSAINVVGVTGESLAWKLADIELQTVTTTGKEGLQVALPLGAADKNTLDLTLEMGDKTADLSQSSEQALGVSIAGGANKGISLSGTSLTQIFGEGEGGTQAAAFQLVYTISAA